MHKPYEIVHAVQERHRGVAVRVAGITGKSDELYRSHGREPKTHNPDGSGNVSPVDHYMQYCRLYEGGVRGAGQDLDARVHNALQAEFAESAREHESHADIHEKVIGEGCDVSKWLARYDLDTASRNDLLIFDRDCDEAIAAIMAARARARTRLLKIEAERNGGSVQLRRAG